MYPLILKDILLLKKLLLLILGFIIFFFVLENPPAFAIAIAGFAFISNSGGFDDRSRSDVMWNSFPISRSKIVSAKYSTVLLFGVFVVGLVTVLQILLHYAVGMYENPFPELSQLALGFCLILIVAAIYYPIFHKFGEKYARILLMIAVLGTVTIGNIIWHLINPKIASVLEFFSQYSYEQLLAYGFGITVLFYGLSWAISIKIYKEKDF